MLIVLALAGCACAGELAIERSEAPAPLVLRGAAFQVLSPQEAQALGWRWREVLDSDNAADLYIQAINSYVAPPVGLFEAIGNVVGHQWLPEKPGLAGWLEENHKALELVKQGTTRKHCQFPVPRPRQPLLVSIPMPQLAFLKALGRLLVIEGKRFEYTGNYAEAVRSYVALLRLGVHICENPGLIQRSAGISCISQGDRALVLLLAQGRLNQQTLEKLSGELEALADRFSDYSRTVSIEGESFTQALKADLAEEGLEENLPCVREHLEVYWAELEELAKLPTSGAIAPILQLGQKLDKEVKALGEEVLEELNWERLAEVSESEKETMEKQLALVFFTQCIPTVLHGRIMYARAETRMQALRIIVGLNSYKVAAGSWPGNLSMLEPPYLRKLSLDPFSGKPFIYRAGASDWILYSVDWNLKDDGGVDGDYPRLWPVKDMVYRSGPKHNPGTETD